MTPLLSTALLRTQSDERLLSLTVQGHEHAFEAIVDRYRRPLLGYLRQLLPGDRAEDVLQAAFVSAWTALRAGASVRDLRPWLYRICHNGALNALARRGYDHAELHEALHGASSPVEDLVSRDALRQTLASVAQLPERQRVALLAVAIEGRPHGEVARELGMSDGALRQLVHRARSSVRSAVTAVTPAPLINWLMQLGARGAGLLGAAKVAVIVVATGAVVAGGATHAIGHRSGPAVAAAATAPRALVPAAPHRAAAHRVRRRRATRTHDHRRVVVSIGGRAEPVALAAPKTLRRHGHRVPSPAAAVTHRTTTERAPTTTPTPVPTHETPAPPASPGPTQTTSAPAATTPAPAPEPAPCHEVACRPVTTTTTDPLPPPPPTTTEPAPGPAPPPPSDAPRI